MTTTYRFTMTVTRAAVYEIDVPFDTDDDEAVRLYAQELTPDDMEEIDDTTLDMDIEYTRINTEDQP